MSIWWNGWWRQAAGDFVLPDQASLIAHRAAAIEASASMPRTPRAELSPQHRAADRGHASRGDVRVDGWIETGAEVTPHYDPLLAKLIAHGADRAGRPSTRSCIRGDRRAAPSGASKPISPIWGAVLDSDRCFRDAAMTTATLDTLRLRARAHDRGAGRGHPDEPAGLARAVSATGMSACRRADRWMI